MSVGFTSYRKFERNRVSPDMLHVRVLAWELLESSFKDLRDGFIGSIPARLADSSTA